MKKLVEDDPISHLGAEHTLLGMHLTDVGFSHAISFSSGNDKMETQLEAEGDYRYSDWDKQLQISRIWPSHGMNDKVAQAMLSHQTRQLTLHDLDVEADTRLGTKIYLRRRVLENSKLRNGARRILKTKATRLVMLKSLYRSRLSD